jgi:hypothetical protein
MNFSRQKKQERETAAIGKRIGMAAPNIMVMKTMFMMLEYL